MNVAIGIAVNEREVKVAYLAKKKGGISIVALESISLHAPLEQVEQQRLKSKTESETLSTKDFDDLFASNQNQGITDNKQDKNQKTNKVESNRDKLFTFLNNFPLTKAKLAINLHPSTVNYYYFNDAYGLKDNKLHRWVKQSIEDRYKHNISDDNFDFIHNDNGTVVAFVYDSVPPLLESLEEMATYRGEKIHIALMDTNEVALVNLIRNNYHFTPEETSAIIHIENNFSRIIFMRGRSLLHCSAVINEGALSPNIIEIIYSKILYEQDQNDIPELSQIILTGKCKKLKTHAFLGAKFPKITTEYILSPKINYYTTSDKNSKQFSEYALPISLAWKVLEKNNKNLFPSNLVPHHILDRQKVLKLTYHGYILLALLAFSAFTLAWQIGSKQDKINYLKDRKERILTNMASSQWKVDKVNELQMEIKKLRRNMTLVDSLGNGYNQLTNFIQDLNTEVKKTRGIWIKNLKNSPDGYNVKGLSLNSEKIPQLSYNIGNVNLKKVTLSTVGNKKVFKFEMDKKTDLKNVEPIFGNLKVPPYLPPTSDKVQLAKGYSTKKTAAEQTLNKTAKSIESNKKLVQRNNISKNVTKAKTRKTKSPESTKNFIHNNDISKEIPEVETLNAEKPVQSSLYASGTVNKSHEIELPETQVSITSNKKLETSSDKHKTETKKASIKPYTIYVSAHASLISAKQDVTRLKSKGCDAQIYRHYSSSNNMHWYIVYTGIFSTRDRAVEWARRSIDIIGEKYVVGNIR